jgi:class 3 adenylate cyclase
MGYNIGRAGIRSPRAFVRGAGCDNERDAVMDGTYARHWTWHFDQPPEAIWPALADTARFNDAAGFPKQRIIDEPQPDGTVRYTAEARIGPLALVWRELPVEWVLNQRFRHARLFRTGPLKSMTATLALAPEGAGCRAEYTLQAEPANLLGRAILATAFFKSAHKTFDRLVSQAREHVAGRRAEPYEYRPATLSGEAQARLDAALARIEMQGAPADLVARLRDHILAGSEVDLLHMRPLRLARQWRVGERGVIELCLLAVKTGLLSMHWDLLCPNCRGPKVTVASLDKLPQGAHCPTCNIDYGRDFARNVELTFRPSQAIRPIESGEFCLFGPMTTPHVVVQQTLAPGETRELPAVLPRGDYRLRGLHPGAEVLLEWREGGFPELIVDANGVSAGAPSPDGIITLVNRGDGERTVVIESRDWVRDALTAHRVTSMQAFRDLFATEALRPGDEVGVSHVTLMFTDLRGSTALYARIGDGRAYRLVREHFAFLAETVRNNNGGIVKTIGDAVMATFSDPADAVRAALAVQGNAARFNRAQRLGAADSVVIKLGLHGGPCIAVTLNDRLDYFGSTVNLAARLQGQSAGGDIVISQSLAEDSAVAPLLRDVPSTVERATVKGFAAPVAFLRLQPSPSTAGDG